MIKLIYESLFSNNSLKNTSWANYAKMKSLLDIIDGEHKDTVKIDIKYTYKALKIFF